MQSSHQIHLVKNGWLVQTHGPGFHYPLAVQATEARPLEFQTAESADLNQILS